jgi:hypothetical protein
MLRFRQWLLIVEARTDLVPPEVLQGYEAAFREELQKVIARTRNPGLRARLQDMLRCPVRDGRGRCRSFSDYIVAALIHHGVHRRYDLEACLSYVIGQMLMPRDDAGQDRSTVFGGFVEKPGETPAYNPLQVRFMRSLEWAVNAIASGRIPRLAIAERRPSGTVSIGRGRDGDDQAVSPDEIAGRPSSDAGLDELVGDIGVLLRRKERQTGLPLAALFAAIVGGMSVEEQRRRFGDRAARVGRRTIIQTIEEYARATDNRRLLAMLRRLQGGADQQVAAPVRPVTPVLSDKERDYASIASVIARFDRPVGSADLGKYRRRWLEYPPREAGSGFRNRLEEVLAAMVRDRVLRATKTRNGAAVYSPGPRFGEVAPGAVAETA